MHLNGVLGNSQLTSRFLRGLTQDHAKHHLPLPGAEPLNLGADLGHPSLNCRSGKIIRLSGVQHGKVSNELAQKSKSAPIKERAKASRTGKDCRVGVGYPDPVLNRTGQLTKEETQTLALAPDADGRDTQPRNDYKRHPHTN
jgi:hypothetical protein